jgi:hypothetical protein
MSEQKQDEPAQLCFMEKKVPEEIEKTVRGWDRMAICLRFLFIFLVVFSITGSLVVSTFTTELSQASPLILKFCGFGATLSISFLTGLDVAGKANKVRRAVRHFTAARARFQAGDNYGIDALTKAYEEAEDIIGDVNYIPQRTQGQTSESRNVQASENRNVQDG